MLVIVVMAGALVGGLRHLIGDKHPPFDNIDDLIRQNTPQSWGGEGRRPHYEGEDPELRIRKAHQRSKADALKTESLKLTTSSVAGGRLRQIA